MLLDSKKSELLEMNEELKKLEAKFYYEKSNLSLEKKIEGLKKDIAKLTGEISILEKITDLEKRYNNDEPIIYSYNDNGETDDILLTSNDVNYERAYFQQKSLLELEYAYYNKQPIKYNRGTVIAFGDDSYDEFYQKKKQELLNLEIDKRAKDSIKPYAGKHFKSDKISNPVKKEDTSEEFMPYMGGYFKPNDLDMEYAVFKKDGELHVVGNFTSDWLRDNYNQVVGDFINDKDITSIKLWNRLEKGDTPLDGFDVKVRVNNDGSIKVIGNVDNLEYHNQILDNDLGERKEGKHFKDVDTEVMSEDAQNKKDDSGLEIIPKEVDEEKDMSGLDIIPNSPDFANLSSGAEKVEPVKGRKITRKEAKPSLIKRGIEKFKGLKKWQKIAIVAGVIAVVGVGVFVVGPQIANLINNLMNPENVNVANQVTQVTSSVQDTATQAAQSIDYSSIGGAGHTVFSNAADAANNVNGAISNQWFSNNPIDVFNTATNSYMGLTPDQLSDPNLLAELAKDPNNAMLFGNSMSDPSGFIGLDDVVNTVTKIR